MKITAILLVGLIGVTLTEPVQPGALDTPMARRVLNKYMGRSYEIVVTEAEVRSAPMWSSDAPNPPLSARTAIQAARFKVQGYFPEAKRWRVVRVALDALGQDRWVYVITFDPTRPETIEKMAPAFEAVVLMDGKAADVRNLK